MVELEAGKICVVTALHALLDFESQDPADSKIQNNVQIYISTFFHTGKDRYSQFESILQKCNERKTPFTTTDFEPVPIILESLHARQQWLSQALIKNRKDLISQLVDPEYDLILQPMVDIVFLHVPECIQSAISNGKFVPLKLRHESIMPDMPFLAAAFHDTGEGFDPDLYKATLKPTTPLSKFHASRFIHPGRSINLGKVSDLFFS